MTYTPGSVSGTGAPHDTQPSERMPAAAKTCWTLDGTAYVSGGVDGDLDAG